MSLTLSRSIKNKFINFLVKECVRRCSTLQEISHNCSFIIEEPDTCQRTLKVAIIGLPNAGKSTFINHLMDRKVCPTSSKIHTTRKKAQSIFTEEDSQIIFLDTPGLITTQELKRYNLEKSFLRDSHSSLYEADTIGVIHDVGDLRYREKLDFKIMKLLDKYQTKTSFLVLNKVDVLKSKRKLLEITKLITMNCLDGKQFKDKPIEFPKDHCGWPYFKEIFMVSSLTGDGLSEVKQYLVKSAKPGKWLYAADKFSDQTPEHIIVSTIKAAFLDFLQQEIPYQLQPKLELYEVNAEGVINTVVIVKCISERIAKLVAGVGNGRLKQITESVQRDLENAFHQFVRIRIILQPPKLNK